MADEVLVAIKMSPAPDNAQSGAGLPKLKADFSLKSHRCKRLAD